MIAEKKGKGQMRSANKEKDKNADKTDRSLTARGKPASL
jgi:hypothetical protein